MSEVARARDAYQQAQRDAKELISRARIRLGKAIREAREEHSQEDIAKYLSLSTERLRIFQREYEGAEAPPGESPIEAELAARIAADLIEPYECPMIIVTVPRTHMFTAGQLREVLERLEALSRDTDHAESSRYIYALLPST